MRGVALACAGCAGHLCSPQMGDDLSTSRQLASCRGRSGAAPGPGGSTWPGLQRGSHHPCRDTAPCCPQREGRRCPHGARRSRTPQPAVRTPRPAQLIQELPSRRRRRLGQRLTKCEVRGPGGLPSQGHCHGAAVTGPPSQGHCHRATVTGPPSQAPPERGWAGRRPGSCWSKPEGRAERAQPWEGATQAPRPREGAARCGAGPRRRGTGRRAAM